MEWFLASSYCSPYLEVANLTVANLGNRVYTL